MSHWRNWQTQFLTIFLPTSLTNLLCNRIMMSATHKTLRGSLYQWLETVSWIQFCNECLLLIGSVFFPAVPTAPDNVMRIIYNDTFFGVQWMPSTPSRALSMTTFGSRARNDEQLSYPRTLSNYTVFWCKSVRDSPIQCEGQLYSQQVPATQTSLNVTVPDPRANYQFAVEANQGSFSSGMVWSNCIVMANGNGSQVNKLEARPQSPNSLEVSWVMPCSVQNGIIVGFNIYICPVEDVDIYGDEIPNCPSKQQLSLSYFNIFAYFWF